MLVAFVFQLQPCKMSDSPATRPL